MHFNRRFSEFVEFADSKFLHATFLDPRFKGDSLLREPRELVTPPAEELKRRKTAEAAAATLAPPTSTSEEVVPPVPKYTDAIYRSILSILRTYSYR